MASCNAIRVNASGIHGLPQNLKHFQSSPDVHSLCAAHNRDSPAPPDYPRPPTMDLPAAGHEPVLVDEIISLLQPKPGDTFIDCTLGRGGHASVIGPLLGANGTYVGLDVDPHNLEFAQQRLKDVPCRVRLFHANFAEINDVWNEIGKPPVNAILADL